MAIDAVYGNLLGQYIASAAKDVTGVFTQSFTQVFRAARPIKVSILPQKKMMEQPLETGATTVDHVILQPIEAELSMIIPNGEYRNAMAEIKQLYEESILLIVQTKADTYSNMVISAMPHEESAEMMDAIALALKLREVQFATTTTKIVPKDPTKNSTVDRGVQPGKDPSDKGKASASQLYSWWFG